MDVLKEKKESRNILASLSQTVTYGGYALLVVGLFPQLPSYRSELTKSSSQLSGSTAVGATSEFIFTAPRQNLLSQSWLVKRTAMKCTDQ